MSDTISWSLEGRRHKTAEKELANARLVLAQVQKWSKGFTTEQAPENLSAMDRRINNIEAALRRVADPEQLNRPDLARDLAVVLSDYYDKRGRWDDWIKLGPIGLDACSRLGDPYSLREAYPLICNGIGLMHRMLGNSEEAISYYEQALTRAITDELKSDALTNITDIHRLQGKTEEALQCAQYAIKLAQQSKDNNREAKGLEYLGLTYVSCKMYDDAIDCYQKALQLRKRAANLPRTAMVLSMLAFALTGRGSQENLEHALQHHKEAYDIEVKLQNRQSIARYFGDVAVLYNQLGEYKRSIENSEIALYYNEDIGFLRGVALNHVRLARSYWGLGQSDRMLFHVEQVLSLEKNLTAFDRKLSHFNEVLLATVQYLFELDEVLKAERYAASALKIATKDEDSELIHAATLLVQKLNQKSIS